MGLLWNNLTKVAASKSVVSSLGLLDKSLFGKNIHLITLKWHPFGPEMQFCWLNIEIGYFRSNKKGPISSLYGALSIAHAHHTSKLRPNKSIDELQNSKYFQNCFRSAFFRNPLCLHQSIFSVLWHLMAGFKLESVNKVFLSIWTFLRLKGMLKNLFQSIFCSLIHVPLHFLIS